MSTIVGVHEHERHAPREVLIDIALQVDMDAASRSDLLEHTVDYEALVKRVIQLVESSTRHTLEALAGDIADVCLEQALVRGVHVKVDKPGAISSARSVAVSMERGRSDDSA